MKKKYKFDVKNFNDWPKEIKEKLTHIFYGAFVLGMVFTMVMMLIFRSCSSIG